ncbi:ribosome biogenesis GTPase Der [candidate division WOR-3 bacterium]|nr:ribosome biogenesis GTPase Der [candidate division WOR-3 bacterium]
MIVITGRENVGKSTLLNRFVRKNVAVVGKTPGITRDFVEKWVERDGKRFKMVDTGGIFPCKIGMKKKVQEKLWEVLERADLILFVVNLRDGVTPLDSDIASSLRKLEIPIWLVVNKVDTRKEILFAQNFRVLGFDTLYPISALKAYGVEDLITDIPKKPSISHSRSPLPIVSIMGRPNVGKSTYLNILLGDERMIVDKAPGTTIDVIDVTLKFHGKELILTDTPGLKRKSRVRTDVERGTTALTISNTKRIDIGIVMIESNSALTKEDKKIIQLLQRRGKGIVLAANKSDLGKYFLKHNISFASHIPIIYLSALSGKNIDSPIREALRIYNERKKKIPADGLDKLRSEMQYVRLSGLYQVRVSPPCFKITTRKKLKGSAIRYIEKSIRAKFGFRGVPIEFIS